MKTLGWLVWAFCCVLLLWGLTGLHKKKRRGRRIFFCIRIAAGLALNYFTSFSKFHLLWIVPLPALFILFGWGSLVGGFFAWHKITARKPKKTTLPPGSYPPFETLEWKDGGWEGKVHLPAWSGFQSRGGNYCAEDSKAASNGAVKIFVKPAKDKDAPLEPSEAQCRAMDYQIQHGEDVVQSILTALLPHYHEFKKELAQDGGDLPSVSDPAEFRKMIGLGNVHVLPHASEGLAYVGLEFGCDWEDEHGLGVVVLGNRVIEISDAQIAFSWEPDSPPAPAQRALPG